jgi:GT2 family glycosyltransferase
MEIARANENCAAFDLVHSALRISAIVTAYQRMEQTLVTLRKLQDCHPPPAEILVHVDGYQTACASAIRAAFPGVRVLVSEGNVGPGGGRNQLVAAASYSIVASFDDDSYPVDADYFESLASAFARYPAAGVVSARVYERGATVEPAVQVAEWVADFSGGACAYRREVFLQAGGYVPLPLAYGMEEVDLALRLHARGGRVLRSHELRVFHDSDLARHATPPFTAASLSNLALLAYLRYPFSLWWLGFAQVANRVRWLMQHRRWRGILQGIAIIPDYLRDNRHHRQRIDARFIRSYLALRRATVIAPVQGSG